MTLLRTVAIDLSRLATFIGVLLLLKFWYVSLPMLLTGILIARRKKK